MTILNGDALRIVVTATLGGVGDQKNIFYGRFQATGSPTQVQILEAVREYMIGIYDIQAANMDSAVTIQDAVISKRDTVLDEWIQEGIEAMAVVGLSSTGMIPPKSPVRSTARTASGKSPGKKRYSGYDESTQDSGVLNGISLARLALATVAWIAGFENVAAGIVIESGIFSEQDNIFKAFIGSGLATNVFGSQDSRGLK